jgi:hypothetical protein
MANGAIQTLPLPDHLQRVERKKAHLLLEAHTLKAQARFIEAAERFAQAARYEEQLADWAAKQALTDLYYLHAFSALLIYLARESNGTRTTDQAHYPNSQCRATGSDYERGKHVTLAH